MHEKVTAIRKQFQDDLQNIHHARDVEQLKVKYLGKKGALQDLMGFLRDCTPEERPRMGQTINALKEEIAEYCTQALTTLERSELQARLEEEKIDPTLPGRRRFLGRMHPINSTLKDIIDILKGMGFTVQYGPEIDTEYYNFDGLNYPEDHPARTMQDTFYITKDFLLRSQTTNTELHVMETHRPPIRVIVPGTVYRNETISARSHVFFHQVEGIYINKGVSFSDLLATMEEFWKKLFHRDVKMRFRPSFFPFVEPGLEIDLSCTACFQKGCGLCKHTGWLEVAGAGILHPEVLKNGGIDPEVYSGFAWGMGVERVAMLRNGINDIRNFFENDQRFLDQFG